MEITISIITRELSSRFPVRANREVFADHPLTSIMFLGESEPQPQYLYLVSAAEINRANFSFEKSTLICLGSPSRELTQSDCLFIHEDCDIKQVYNAIQQVMEEFYTWRKRLRELNCNVNSMQRLISESYPYIRLEMFLLDKDYNYVALTENYIKKHGPIIGKKKLRMDALNDLLANPLYIAAKEYDSCFLYPSKGEEYILCYNIKMGKKYMGRLLTDSNGKPYSQGDKKLVEYLGQFISNIFKNDFEEHVRKRERDIFYKTIESILEGNSPGNKKISPILKEQGWNIECQYEVIVFSLMDTDRNEFSKEYYRNYLEDRFLGSCVLRKFEQIILVVNLTLLHKSEKIFHNDLLEFLEETDCKAGKSNRFSDISLLTYHKKQAEMALVVGQKKNDAERIYKYEDLRYDCLFAEWTTDLLPDHLCSPILLQLKEYDKKEDTELYHTLFIFIKEQFNVTHAAEKLFIHRTTLLYRLERIKTITGIESFSSWDLILDLMISYTLMGANTGLNAEKTPPLK